MTKVDLGTIGAVVQPGGDGAFVDMAVGLEALGVPTVWLTGGPMEGLHQIAEVVRATDHVRVASGIIALYRFSADEVDALYADLESTHPGRFVVGLGGAPGPRPVQAMVDYVGRLSVPPERLVMAALGPRMLDTAREHAGGAFPVLVTPAWTAEARARLGDDVTLAVEQLMAVESDPDAARALARGPLGFLGTMPAYQASFRRQGFTDDEIGARADRLVDALVPGGEPAAVAASVRAQLDAGADHVAVSITAPPDATYDLDRWRRLAEHLPLG